MHCSEQEGPCDLSSPVGPAVAVKPGATPRIHRISLQVALDGAAWVVALALATALRFDFDVTRIDGLGLLAVTGLALLTQPIAGWLMGLYRGRWRIGSSDEVVALTGAVAAVSAVLFGFDLAFHDRPVPLGALLAAGVSALLLMGATRYEHRRLLERRLRPTGPPEDRMLVFGAGEGGAQAIEALFRAQSSAQEPIALLDDDPRKRNLRIRGVPVVGDRTQIAKVAKQLDADSFLIAIPSADATLIRELTADARAAGLKVKVLPSISELLGTPVGVADIRTPSENDLLGRRPVELDVAAIAHYLTGKRVLVTGAGGSIGSELCRQIARFAPGELIMVDHDESGLHGAQLSVEGRALLDNPSVVLSDIRDRRRMMELFEERRPEVVFHAAALKHLPLLESHPGEALRTNVWGTWNVLEAAMANDVRCFVNVSTDKAANPTSVLGYSKAIAARLTAHAALKMGEPYLSVRFGNVLRSRGSVLFTFAAQAAAGGPLTVTHPDVTRFFMTAEEAVQLVIQGGAVGTPGEVLVLDMGDPVRISDVAKRFVEASGLDLQIEYTGLRPGEKLHEVLLGAGEVEVRSSHPRILHVAIEPLDPCELKSLDARADASTLRAQLRDLCLSGRTAGDARARADDASPARS